MRFLRGYVLASLAASVVFTLVLAGIEREGNTGNIMAGWTVFVPYALVYTAVLAPLGYFLLRRLGRHRVIDFAAAGLGLGWISTVVLFHSPWGLIAPMALAFAAAGLAAGVAFRAGYGASKSGSAALLACLLLTGAGCAGDTDSGATDAATTDAGLVRKVLVIGIDGVRPDVMAEVETPNLDALIADGAFSDSALTGRPTVSGPGWSSFLIGVWPDKHGVTNNDFTGKRYDVYPDFLTRIEAVRPELNTFAAIDWLPLGADSAGGPVIGDAPDRKFVFDGYELTWPGADSAVVAVSVRELRDGDPDAAFVYLGNPDEASHEAGSIGVEYREAIALADWHIGQLLEAVRSRPTFPNEDWLILVSTDHGRRADGGHGGDSMEESTIFYIASGPSALRGRITPPPAVVDVAVTALVHLGIAIDPAWNLDGKAVGLRTGL